MSQHVLRIGGREYQAEVKELTPVRATVVVDGKEYEIDLVQLGRRTISAEAVRTVSPAPAAAAARPAAPAQGATPVSGTAPAAAHKHAQPTKGEGGIVAPMPGLIIAIKAKEGDTVAAGQALMVMEAMKMENAITTPYAGTVSKIYVREGDSISEGDLLVEVARPKMTTL
jgi:biotin carboxyl carrier protein